MNFLPSALSLLVTNCLAAADNSSNRSSTSAKISSSQQDTVNVEVAQMSKELQKYVDFDPKEYFAGFRDKQVTIEAAMRMSLDELNSYERVGEPSTTTNLCSNNVHKANSYLVKVVKLGKLLNVQQATFDAWTSSPLSAIRFMELIKESLQNHGNYCESLAEYASKWHFSTGNLFLLSGEDPKEANNHFDQSKFIKFIYYGLTNLNADDSEEFEKCIKIGSINGIRKLAKKVVTSKQYSRDVLEHFPKFSSSVSNVAESNKIALIGGVFNMEILLTVKEEELEDFQKRLLVDHKIHFNGKSIVSSKDPKEVVDAYEQCMEKACDNGKIQRLCMRALECIWKIESLTSNIKKIDDFENPTTADIECSCILKDVIEPAIIHINSNRISKVLDNADFFPKLKERNIDSYEKGLEEKSSLKHKGTKFSTRLLLIEKILEYLHHDFAYIRNDYDKMAISLNFEKGWAFDFVNDVVQELKMDLINQKCSFDFNSGKLKCKSPEMSVLLLLIHGNKFACNMLIEFCKEVRAEQSISTAIVKFEEQRTTYLIELEVLRCLDPSYIKDDAFLAYYR